MCLRKVGIHSNFYQGFLLQNVPVCQILCNTSAPPFLPFWSDYRLLWSLLPPICVLCQAHSKEASHDVLPPSYNRAVAACFPLPFARPDCQPTHLGQAGLQLSPPDTARCLALQALQLLGLCLSLVSLINLSVLDSQESAVGTFVMGQEHCEHHLSTRTFQLSTAGQSRNALSESVSLLSRILVG